MTEFYHRFFTAREARHAVIAAFASMPDFRHAMNAGLLDDVIKEKIMLAVTEVNGCEMCHAFHSREAGKLGINGDEIGNFVIGRVGIGTTPEEQVLDFARHYAQTDGNFETDRWLKLVGQQGDQGAKGILGAIRIITMGNVYGIAAGALRNRFRGQPVTGSRLSNELAVLLSLPVAIPVALLLRLGRRLGIAPPLPEGR